MVCFGAWVNDVSATINEVSATINEVSDCLRKKNLHRRLRCVNTQVVLKYDDKGKKYLEYTEDVSKTNAGEN